MVDAVLLASIRPPAGRFLRHSITCYSAALLSATLSWRTLATAAPANVAAHTGQIELPTYAWAAVRHPYFRGTDKVNIYPYPMLDFLSRDKTNRTYRTVVLENDYLRITFLPELGGKIHEVIDKTTGQPMFYVNHVVKPGLIGQCGAWTSGGVEWNTGPQGHTVSCMQPVEVRILPPEIDGSRSVAVGEIERIYGTKWTVVVTLRPDRSFIEERIRIYNPTETIRPYYFWNCTAAPNTAGFRFIYPMTLGMDHSGEKFFHWPIDAGKDLRYGTNYQDASSIFAYFCDRDFFGSYNDDLDRGVVSYANHHQLPGKKAWTWGHGSYGSMHQADLTDTDGPYNEVQTGPLLTQGEVGRLDPCEAVEWREWWYPVRGIGGFVFANKNVAANVQIDDGQLHLGVIGSGTWHTAKLSVSSQQQVIAEARCDLNPLKPIQIRFPLEHAAPSLEIAIRSGTETIADWRFPIELPERNVPAKRSSPQEAFEFVQAGWRDYLFARFSEAENRFKKALEKETKCPDAHVGLAYVYLDKDEARSAEEARAALAIDPDSGSAHYIVALAESRLGHNETALEEAWKATLDPATAVPARALIAKLLIRARHLDGALEALSQSGPWQSDCVCRNRLALAFYLRGNPGQATSVARLNLEADPLDDFANSILWMTSPEKMRRVYAGLLGGNVPTLLELVAQDSSMGCRQEALRLLNTLYVNWPGSRRNSLLDYWYLDLSALQATAQNTLEAALGKSGFLASVEDLPNTWPHQYELVEVLEKVVKLDPQDGQATLSLADLLFHLGRYAEGRETFKRAAQLGGQCVVACRALGMAAKSLDGDLKTARDWLEKASQADPQDAVVARDLATVLAGLADKADSEVERRSLISEAGDRLKAAFEAGKNRSDFVALLAREQNKLGDFAQTASMLDQVRVTIWEGAHEVHDLFEQAHLALGEEQLKAGHPAEALAEFNRALEYPANLATGRLENAPEAHIHYQRGNALAALGKSSEARAEWRLAAEAPDSGDVRIRTAREKAKQALEIP